MGGIEAEIMMTYIRDSILDNQKRGPERTVDEPIFQDRFGSVRLQHYIALIQIFLMPFGFYYISVQQALATSNIRVHIFYKSLIFRQCKIN